MIQANVIWFLTGVKPSADGAIVIGDGAIIVWDELAVGRPIVTQEEHDTALADGTLVNGINSLTET